MFEDFKRLIEQSDTILVTTHVGPDPDAFTSLLLTGTTLKLNFPAKNIVMNSEEHTGGLSVLDGYQQITFDNLAEAIKKHKPNLIILVDAMNFSRCTRANPAEIEELIEKQDIKVAIIDHHEAAGVVKNDVYINQESPAAVQDVYEVLFEHLKLRKPEGYARTTLLGIYSDSGGFVYENKRHKKTLQLASELIENGANIEEINSLIHRFSADTMHAIGELINNLDSSNGYTYSFVSDSFTSQWVSNNKDFEELKLGIAHFVNEYIRNIDGRHWGFVVYKDIRSGDDIYGVSLRATGGTVNVA